jgi:hypothetical protein
MLQARAHAAQELHVAMTERDSAARSEQLTLTRAQALVHDAELKAIEQARRSEEAYERRMKESERLMAEAYERRIEEERRSVHLALEAERQRNLAADQAFAKELSRRRAHEQDQEKRFEALSRHEARVETEARRLDRDRQRAADELAE